MKESTIRRLIKIVEESEIESLEVSRFFRKIKITKKLNVNGQGDPSTIIAEPKLPAAQPTTVAPPPMSAEKEPADLVSITSPMVGTFYRAPSADSDSFVEIGTRVTPGDTVCIIEAMKLMNEIEAEVAGVIKEIAVQNGEPVEYGQTLFLIDPHG